MCGIVGVASYNVNRQGREVFEDLMLVSNLRGRWGAGICVVGEKKMMTYKTEWSGIDACDIKGYNDHIRDDKVHVLLGHTRWPTKGGGGVANAHPHSFANVTGVHNGTLGKVAGKNVKDHESDSKAFYADVSAVGFDKAFANIMGAFAFVFIDHKEETLNFIRNGQRPLAIAKVNWGKPGQALVWASEKEMIEFILKRKNITDYSIEELPVSELWSIPVGFTVGQDFSVEKGKWAGQDLWKPAKKNEVAPNWSRGFRGNTTSSVSSINPRQTYVFKDGEFVEKSSITNPPAQKVSLPAAQGADERKGKETLRLPHIKAAEEGVADKQRSSATTKISLGSNGAAFLKNLIGSGTSKAEKEFYGDTVVDLFPKRDNDSQSFEQSVEAEFNKLLATKADPDAPAEESCQLWEDCQYEDTAEPMRETLKGHYVPESEYKRLLALGCVWHGDAATEDEEIYWIDRDQYIFDFVIYDPEAMADLSLHFPNHPLMQEWIEKNEKAKNVNSDLYPTSVAIH